jgi:hypothetical protein
VAPLSSGIARVTNGTGIALEQDRGGQMTKHFIFVTYKNGARDVLELSADTYTVWSVRMTDNSKENAFAKGSIMFGRGPQNNVLALRLKEVSSFEFSETFSLTAPEMTRKQDKIAITIGNPLEDSGLYDNPLN